MKKWVILTQPDCLHCVRATKMLNDEGEMNVIRLDISERPDLKLFLKGNGLYTVPQVYMDGEWMGGADDLQEYLSVQ